MASAPNDWQLECHRLKQRGAYILKSGQWSDCTFLVGTEPNQVLVEGHKLILAMASPVFEAMFYGNMAEGNHPIPILDVQIDAFKALLEYIYTDNINISSFDKACEICYGAKKYMLPHLVKECTRYLWSDLYPKNACRAYEFAHLFEENNLMEKCLQIISTNTKEILNDSSFEEADINTVITMFSLDHLNVDSELDLFEAISRYAKAAEKRNSSVSSVDISKKSPLPSTSSQDQVVNVESSAESSPAAPPEPGRSDAEPAPQTSQLKAGGDNPQRGSVRAAVEKIRFLTLSPQQFAQGPARSPLLTESESFAILMGILSNSNDVPMPEGFSTSRLPRKMLVGIQTSVSKLNSTDSQMSTLTVDTPSPVSVEVVWTAERQPNPPYPRPIRHEACLRLPSIIHNASGISVDHMERVGPDVHRIYCQRPIVGHIDYLNTSVLDCSVTFMVDKNICVLGIQVPTQAPSEEGAAGLGGSSVGGNIAYSELLYAHLLDADGARLTYTHYTCRVPYHHMLDIMFNRPVYVQRNKVYKVGVVFNKVGWYPLGTAAQQVAAESVFFNFGIGQSSDSVRDGLIRTIIFTY